MYVVAVHIFPVRVCLCMIPALIVLLADIQRSREEEHRVRGHQARGQEHDGQGGQRGADHPPAGQSAHHQIPRLVCCCSCSRYSMLERCVQMYESLCILFIYLCRISCI